MIIKLKREKYFFTHTDPEAKKLFESLPLGATIELETPEPGATMTKSQRGALYIWFGQVAEILNAAGFDQKVFFTEKWREGITCPWSAASIKECLYKPILASMTNKTSTEHMGTKEPSEICTILGVRLSELTGITPPPWPSRFSEEDMRHDRRGE